jgi:hypothetical protein
MVVQDRGTGRIVEDEGTEIMLKIEIVEAAKVLK